MSLTNNLLVYFINIYFITRWLGWNLLFITFFYLVLEQYLFGIIIFLLNDTSKLYASTKFELSVLEMLSRRYSDGQRIGCWPYCSILVLDGWGLKVHSILQVRWLEHENHHLPWPPDTERISYRSSPRVIGMN